MLNGARQPAGGNSGTQIVMLGTGTPYPDPDRSGPATAIIVNGTPYLFDFGPGVVRQAAAAYRKGVTAFGRGIVNIKTAFLTHLHSDHTAGFPDLIFTPWTMGRTEPLEIYGPPGIKAMTENVINAWQVDIDARADRMRNPTAFQVNAHEIAPGIVYRDQNITVKAFPVHHEEMKDSFGFRIETPDRVIVISGDTTPVQTIIDNSSSCDVLIHEAYSLASYSKISPAWQKFRRTHHTSSKELAEIATQTNPGLLVLYHRASAGGGETSQNSEQELIDEVRQLYKGPTVTGHDLDIF